LPVGGSLDLRAVGEQQGRVECAEIGSILARRLKEPRQLRRRDFLLMADLRFRRQIMIRLGGLRCDENQPRGETA
jgi:hypothetical protein